MADQVGTAAHTAGCPRRSGGSDWTHRKDSRSETLDPAMPVKVVASSAFAGVKMPDGGNIAFGETTYRSLNINEDSTYLLVKTSVVFGGTEVVNR